MSEPIPAQPEPEPPSPGHEVAWTLPREPLPYAFYRLLPAIYQGEECEFLHRYLEGMGTLWEPLELFLQDPSLLYDPKKTPSPFLPWLASWVSLALNQNWPEKKRRLLISRAVDLYLRRGTRWGIEQFLEIYAGVRPIITEAVVGSTIFHEGDEPPARLGEDAVIGDVADHCFVATVFIPAGEDLERHEKIIRQILDNEKPAHTFYWLRLQTYEPSAGDGGAYPQAG